MYFKLFILCLFMVIGVGSANVGICRANPQAQKANDFYTRLTGWEYVWAFGKEKYPAEPSGDEILIVRELYNKWKPFMNSVKP